jgi:hypothetical protein
MKISDIFVETKKLIIESVFEVEGGSILSTGNRALGYNVVDTRLRPSDPRYIINTFDTATAAANYSDEINLELQRNSRFDPRTARTTPPGAIATTGTKPPLEWEDLNDDRGRLPRQYRLALQNPGYITHGGHRYTRQEIDAFSQLATTRRAQMMRDVEATRPKLLNMDAEDAKNPRAWANRNVTFLNTLGARSLAMFFPWNFRPGLQLAAYVSLKEMLIRMYNTEITDNTTPAEAREKIQRVFGMWFVLFVAPGLLATMTMGTRAAIAIFRTMIRSINLASMTTQQIASFVGGLPGATVMLIKNVIQFLLVEALLYTVARAILMRPEVQVLLLNAMGNHYASKLGEWGFEGAETLNTFVTAQLNAEIIPTLNATFSEVELEEVHGDAMTNLKLDPNDAPVGQPEVDDGNGGTTPEAQPQRQTPDGQPDPDARRPLNIDDL